jgi:hypothetical protein
VFLCNHPLGVVGGLGTNRLFDLFEWFFRVVRLLEPAPTPGDVELTDVSVGQNIVWQTTRLAKIHWERNEEVEGTATVAGVPEVQVSLLQKCAREGTTFGTLVSTRPAWDSQLVLPSLL